MTLQELISNGFEGFPRNRLEFYSPEDLPGYWDTSDYGQIRRFSEGENFEEIALRTWVCTDTTVGFYAILWQDELIAFTYQECRKCSREWTFSRPDGPQLIFDVFNSYAKFEDSHAYQVVDPQDGIYQMSFDPKAKYNWETGPF